MGENPGGAVRKDWPASVPTQPVTLERALQAQCGLILRSTAGAFSFNYPVAGVTRRLGGN